MRDKVYIVWRQEYPGGREEQIVAVCASAKDAEEYIEELVEAEIGRLRVDSMREEQELFLGKKKDQMRQCLYIEDHKVLGHAPV
jgi:hypothetical protein